MVLGCVEKVVAPQGADIQIPHTHSVLFVLNTLSEDISLVNLTEGNVTHPVARAGLWTNRMALDPEGGKVWVVNSGDNALQILDLQGGEEDTVRVGDGRNPYDLAFSQRYRRAYVTGWLDHTLTVVNIDDLQVDTTVEVCTNPEGVEVVGDQVLVACVDFIHGYANGGVMALDARTLSVRWFRPLRTNPQDLVSDEEGDVYVVATGDYDTVGGRLYRLGLDGSVKDSVDLGGTPGRLTYADGVLVVSGFSGGVVLWDAYEEREIRRFMEENVSSALRWGGFLVLALFDRDRVVVMDTLHGNVIAQYPVGDGPVDLLLFSTSVGSVASLRWDRDRILYPEEFRHDDFSICRDPFPRPGRVFASPPEGPCASEGAFVF